DVLAVRGPIGRTLSIPCYGVRQKTLFPFEVDHAQLRARCIQAILLLCSDRSHEPPPIWRPRVPAYIVEPRQYRLFLRRVVEKHEFDLPIVIVLSPARV